MMVTEVTVLLTVYNRLTWLPQAIQGVLSQRFENFKLWVLDDSGFELAKPCISTFDDKRIVYLPNNNNIGVASTLSNAIRRIPQDGIFAIINDDDVWDENFLRTLVPMLEEDSRRVVAFCDHWIIDSDGKIDFSQSNANSVRFGRTKMGSGELKRPAHAIIVHNAVPLAMAAVVRKRPVLEEMSPACGGVYDLWISLQLAAAGGRFIYTAARLTFYRVHPEMESNSNYFARAEQHLFVWRDALQREAMRDYEKLILNRIALVLYSQGRAAARAGDYTSAIALFTKSLHIHPGLRVLMALLVCKANLLLKN